MPDLRFALHCVFLFIIVYYYFNCHSKFSLLCRIQQGQPATVKVAANLIRLFAYNNKVCIYYSFILPLVSVFVIQKL